MSASRTRARPRLLPPARAMMYVLLLLAGLAVIGGFAGLLPEFTADTLAVAGATAGYAVRLTGLALTGRDDLGSALPGRGAGLLALGSAVTAVISALAAVVFAVSMDPTATATVLAVGVLAVTAAYLPALLMLPGVAPNLAARLRRTLDGLSGGVCLLFIPWVLVISPNGQPGPLGFGVAAVTTAGVAVALVTAIPAARRGGLVLCCGAGASLGMVGLAGLTLVCENGSPPGGPSVCAALLIAGGFLVWRGARRPIGSPVEVDPSDPAGVFAVSPLLAVPAAAALAVALHRILTGGAFDRPAIALGVLGIGALSVRETLSALDVRRYARMVSTQEAHFRSLVAESTDVTMVVDSELVVRWQSPAAARQFGLSDQDVVGWSVLRLWHPQDASAVAERLAEAGVATGDTLDLGDRRPVLVEARLRDGFGRWRETESTICDQRATPSVRGLVVHIRDVGERKELERTLHQLTFADQATGLANRRQLLRSVAVLRSAPGGAGGVLLLLELAGFSAINDVCVPEVADAVVAEVVRRLRAGFTESDLVARLGGDEFAVLIETGPLCAYAMTQSLLNSLRAPLGPPAAAVRLPVSAGLVDLTAVADVDEALRQADLARRRAASQPEPRRAEFYDEEMEQALSRQLTLARELPGAVGRGEFDLVFQPIVDLVNQRPVAVEGVLRWRHPTMGTVLPADFLPAVGEAGLTGEIGSWVLWQTCRHLAGWRRDGRDIAVAINLEPQFFVEVAVVELVRSALDGYAVPPDRLIVQICETGLGRDIGTIGVQLAGLRSIGVRTALTSFGIGWASLTHLRRLPLDLLRIGRSFFAAPPGPGQPTLPIIDVLVDLGRRFGMEIVAEDLRAAVDVDAVIRAGVRYGQGRFFAPPEPAEHVEAYLDNFGAGSR